MKQEIRVREYIGRLLAAPHTTLPVIFVCAGFADSAYLTYSRVTGLAPDCGSGTGCAEITLGPLGQVFGFPIAAMGMFFYLAMAVGLAAPTHRAWLPWVAASGSVLSLCLQLVAAHHRVFCIWCTFSAVCALLATCVILLWPPHPLPNRPRFTGALLGVAIFTLFALVIRYHDERGRMIALGGVKWYQVAPLDRPHLGHGRAAVPALVMFLDLTCPKCKSEYPRVSDLMRRSNIRFIIRHFPHSTTRPAYQAAVEVESASTNVAYWQLVDRLIAVWFENEAQMREAVRETGVDVRNTSVGEARVRVGMLLSQQLGIQHTPVYLFCDQHGVTQVEGPTLELLLIRYK